MAKECYNSIQVKNEVDKNPQAMIRYHGRQPVMWTKNEHLGH